MRRRDGTLAGVFTGLWGLLFMPPRRRCGRRVRWRAGYCFALARSEPRRGSDCLSLPPVKLAIAFTMVGVFICCVVDLGAVIACFSALAG